MLAFAAAAAAAACLIFGVAPVLRASRIQAGAVLHHKTRGTSRSRSTARTQRAMVAVQVAASLILLVGAVLFVRSFYGLLTFDPGMRREGITVAALGFHTKQLPPERLNDEQRALVAAIKSVPGVIDAATTTNIPLLGSMWHHGVVVDGTRNDAAFTWIGPGYFDTMGIRLLQGRGLSLDDTRTSTRVAVVNQTFARQFTGGTSPIGRTLRTQAEPGYPVTIYEIVGLIADTKYNSLRSETEAMVYAPDSQYPAIGPWAAVMIHSNGAPADVMRAVKARLRQDNPMLVAEQFDFESRVRDGLVRERLLATLAGFFGGLAALIAIVGIYGMVSFGVAQRRREIGVRVALGAGRGRVVGMVMRETSRLFAAGAAVGGVLAMIGARSTESLLFGLQPDDPLTLGAAGAILAIGAAVASYLPARRAASVNPLVALRQD